MPESPDDLVAEIRSQIGEGDDVNWADSWSALLARAASTIEAQQEEIERLEERSESAELVVATALREAGEAGTADRFEAAFAHLKTNATLKAELAAALARAEAAEADRDALMAKVADLVRVADEGYATALKVFPDARTYIESFGAMIPAAAARALLSPTPESDG